MSTLRVSAVLVASLAMACSGSSKSAKPGGDNAGKSGDMGDMDKKMMGSMKAGGDDKFGPLEHGADWKSYVKVSKQPFFSKPHGKRFVEIYVNKLGHEAYISDKPFPVGTVIVKPSWESENGKPSAKLGPVFVMMKKEKGFSKEHNDWWYAIHWENPPPPFNKDGGLYWRTPSKKVNYCWECHENYDRDVGLPPRAMRNWTVAPAADSADKPADKE